MIKQKVFGIGRIVVRAGDMPRLVALLPQEEERNQYGQVKPPGLHAFFYPYADEVRNIQVKHQRRGDEDQVASARALLKCLYIDDIPVLKNPGTVYSNLPSPKSYLYSFT